MRKYTIERTCRATKNDGSDNYITCEIVTDHCETFAICTNMGPCFTSGKEDPTAGKMAMVNRTISLFARDQAEKASPESAFENHLHDPEVAIRVNDFRLMTSIASFCKMAMKGCPWLQPDLSFAKQVWAQGDKMLNKEYLQPMPEPRRMSRRDDFCQTQSILEAVARVYM